MKLNLGQYFEIKYLNGSHFLQPDHLNGRAMYEVLVLSAKKQKKFKKAKN